MARYRKIPTVIEAEPYKPGMEDGEDELTLAQAKELGIDQIMIDWYSGAVQESGGTFAMPYLIYAGLTGKHYIEPGALIITESDGFKYCFNKKAFESIFEPAPGAALAREMKEARIRLQDLEKAYAAMGQFIPAKKELIGGFRARLEAGEATQQLFNEIMAARISE